MMLTSNLNKKFTPFFSSGYFLVFAVMVCGPIFVYAQTIAVVLGYSIYLIFLLSLLGEMTIDILFYFVGFYGRTKIVERYGRYFWLTQKRIEKLEALLVKHPWKSLFIIKYSPAPIPGFVLIGSSRLEFNRFFYILFASSIPKTFFFTIMAYFFGQAYNNSIKYYDYGQYLIISAAILYVAVSYLFSYFSKKLQNKNE